MKRYLVVGGAGYIGTHVAQELYNAGHRVVVFDNFTSDIGHRVPGVKYHDADIRDNEELMRVMEDCLPIDCVFHFAAFKDAGASMKPAGVSSFAMNNIAGSIILLNAMLYYNIQNIVFSSSAAVYGAPLYTPINETHPTIPSNFYGETKLMVEQLLKWYSGIGHLKYAALRYFNAAGYDLSGNIRSKENNPSNLLPIVMEVAARKGDSVYERHSVYVYGNDYQTHDGTGVRDYIHVDDLANAHILAAKYLENERKNLVVNLGTGEGHSVLDVIRQAKEITGRPIPYKIGCDREGDVATVIASAEKAYKILGWRAEHSDLDTILKSMWSVYNTAKE